MTGLERLVAHRRRHVDWLGVEHEYVVAGPDGAVDFRMLVGAHPHGLAGLHPDDARARWLPDGALLTADGREAEVATAPVPVGPGCSHDALARCDAAYAVLRDGLADDLALQGYSTHLNVSVADRHVLRTARRFVSSHAIPMMLLLDRAESPGLLVRPRPARLELGGEYLSGDPLRAAAVFATASTLALRRRVPRHLRVPVKVEQARERYGFYVDRTAAGPDLYASGRSTRLGGRTAQDQLVRVWDWTRPAAVGVLAEDELRLVDDVVSGSAPLPLESDASAPAPREPVEPAPFGTVLTAARRGRVLLEPRLVTWAFVVLEVRDDRGERCFVNVPGRLLDAFLTRLHAGALDAELATLLARSSTLPVLASSEQTGRVGAFRGLGDPRDLVPGERDPLTGRITPPGGPGSRDQKNQSHESQPGQQPGQPSRALPKPKPGKSLLVVAGAAAAVLVVTGGAFAVVKATSGGDDPAGGNAGAAAPAADPSDDGSSGGASEAVADDGVVQPEEELAPVVRTWRGTLSVDGKPYPATISLSCTDTCTVSGLPLVEHSPQVTKDAPLTGDPEGTLVFKQGEKGSPCNFEQYTWPVTVTLTPQGNQLEGVWTGPRRVVKTCPNGSYSGWSGVAGNFTGKLVSQG